MVCHVVKKTGTTGLLVFLLTLSQSVSAQKGDVNLHAKIRIPVGNIRFDSLLHLITRQTGVKFSVNTRKYPPSRTIHLEKSVLSLGDLLAVIHAKSGIYHTALGAHIIFIDHPPRQINPAHGLFATLPPAPAIKKATVLKTKKQTSPSTSRLYPFITLERLPVPTPQVMVITTVLENNPVIAPYLPETLDTLQTTGGRFTGIAFRPLSIDTTTRKTVNDSPNYVAPKATEATTHPSLLRSSLDRLIAIRLPSLQSNDGQKSAGQRSLFSPEIKPGITTDETFYLNPTIHAGWRFLYGIASWSTNFSVSGFRYGGGVAVGVSDNWRMHFAVTTGKLEKPYDTSGMILLGKATLTRLALTAEKKIHEKWSFHIGITYCMLRTNYYRDGVLTPPFIDEQKVKSFLNPLNPVYTITDNYTDNKAIHRQSWIGLQAGIFYHINFSRKR